MVDVQVSAWNPAGERWRLLPHRDQRLLWGLRGRTISRPDGRPSP